MKRLYKFFVALLALQINCSDKPNTKQLKDSTSVSEKKGVTSEKKAKTVVDVKKIDQKIVQVTYSDGTIQFIG